MMNRQQKFEQAYAEAHGMPVETFEAYRMGDTYRLPGIAKCWRFWNMALDSAFIPQFRGYKFEGCQYYDADFVDEAIEAAGLRVAQ